MAIAAEMLYAAILGRENPNHPEWAAFRGGLRLSCASGWNFFKVRGLHS